jgi:single-strand DNA-binding protein
MSSVNKCIFVGRVGKQPEVRYTGGGQAVANFSIACNEKYKGKDGSDKETTTWVRCSTWGKLAELCGQYLQKGSLVYVEGKLQNREYEKDGQKKTSTEIVAREVVFLSSKGDRQQQGSSQRGAPIDDGFGPPPAPFPADDLDAMPF